MRFEFNGEKQCASPDIPKFKLEFHRKMERVHILMFTIPFPDGLHDAFSEKKKQKMIGSEYISSQDAGIHPLRKEKEKVILKKERNPQIH